MRILVTAEEAWGFFQQNKKDDLCEIIAENPDYGIVIWLSNCDGDPDFQVTADNDIIFEEFACDAMDCRETCKYIYDEYLTERVIGNLMSADDLEYELSEIEEREKELDRAFDDLLWEVLDADFAMLFDNPEEVFDDIKEHFLEYLYRKHGISVRRPMHLEDEDGDEFYTEYPYDCMIYEDEDNPFYQ